MEQQRGAPEDIEEQEQQAGMVEGEERTAEGGRASSEVLNTGSRPGDA